MDATDRRILAVLQRRGDVSHAELAETVASSPASCWRRVRALETAGVLGPTVRLVEPGAIGLKVNVMCSIRITRHSGETRGQFESFVAGRDEIVECFSMSGEWDYLLRVVAADVEAYNRFLMHTLLGHPAVAQASSHFVLEMVKYTTALPV